MAEGLPISVFISISKSKSEHCQEENHVKHQPPCRSARKVQGGCKEGVHSDCVCHMVRSVLPTNHVIQRETLASKRGLHGHHEAMGNTSTLV